MFWTENFLAKRRAEWLQRVTKFQYLTNGEWKDAVITDKRVDGNALKITTVTNDDGDAATITAVRILDKDGDVAGQKTENIEKKATQGVLTLWEFPLYEIE